jgi:hypothetical protein
MQSMFDSNPAQDKHRKGNHVRIDENSMSGAYRSGMQSLDYRMESRHTTPKAAPTTANAIKLIEIVLMQLTIVIRADCERWKRKSGKLLESERRRRRRVDLD